MTRSNLPCLECFKEGFCLRHAVQIVHDAEISHAPLVRDVRNFIAYNMVEPANLIDWLAELHRDLPVQFIDRNKQVVELDTWPLEYADDLEKCLDESSKLVKREKERLRDWARTMTEPVPPYVSPFVREPARERFRIAASIIIAAFPNENWPRLIAANDNEPLGRCPSQHSPRRGR